MSGSLKICNKIFFVSQSVEWYLKFKNNQMFGWTSKSVSASKSDLVLFRTFRCSKLKSFVDTGHLNCPLWSTVNSLTGFLNCIFDVTGFASGVKRVSKFKCAMLFLCKLSMDTRSWIYFKILSPLQISFYI